MSLKNKIKNVRSMLKDKKIAIAFSGGADSSLLSYLANKECEKLLAITVNNNIFPEGFIKHAKDFCNKYNIKQEIIFDDFYTHEDILSNNSKRCYLCRKEMYKHIKKVAQKNGFDIIVDGTNITDLTANRPGILVNYENNIKSPFVEARLTSKEIHEYLNKNKIPYSHSTTCLATRVPLNVPFTKDKYERISKAEYYIYEHTNCKIVKVREKFPNCMIEVDDISELCNMDILKLINTYLKDIGYKEVHLKLDELEEYDDIIIDYENQIFSYKLPYNIDSIKTKISDKNICTTDDGLIIGKEYSTYEEALDAFINVLPKIRRTS